MAPRHVDEASDGSPELGPLSNASLRFALSFAAIATVLFCVYYFPYAESGVSEAWVGAYLERYARIVGAVLHVFEPGLSVSQNVISGRFSMSIVKSCDAMEANMLFCAAVLAMPGIAWRKAAVLGAGLAALVALNVLRLCSLYYVGVYLGSWFEVMHIDVWPMLMIAFATLDFLVCVRWLQGPMLRVQPPAKDTANVSA
jgi:exosortase/archaeosortase family protein